MCVCVCLCVCVCVCVCVEEGDEQSMKVYIAGPFCCWFKIKKEGPATSRSAVAMTTRRRSLSASVCVCGQRKTN